MNKPTCELKPIEVGGIPMLGSNSSRVEIIVFVEDLIKKCLKCGDKDCTDKYQFVRHIDKPEMEDLQKKEDNLKKLLNSSFD